MRGTDGAPAGPARVLTLDALRGVAVVLMVAWHASDGWLSPEHRAGLGWSAMRIAGGLAAPLFLVAAGVAVGLGVRRGRGLSRAVVRGLELLVLGHALRLAQWAIDRAAIVQPSAWPALLLGVGFVIAALAALRRSRADRLAALAALFASAHLLALLALGPSLARPLLRFDVLHCIGVSCVLCALVAHGTAHLVRRRRALAWAPSALLALGALFVVSLPIAAPLDRAGGALAWIARGPELHRLAPFPLVPWAAYAMLGCAAALARRDALLASSRRTVLVIFVIAAAIALASFEGGFVFRWLELGAVSGARPIARLAFHAGSAAAIACLLLLFAIARSRTGARLAIVGRASLAIYALHLFVAYGALAGPLARSLDPLACALLVTALIALCAAAAPLAARGSRGAGRAYTLRADVLSAGNSSA